MDHHYSRLMRMIRHAQDGGTAGGGEGTGMTDGTSGGNQGSATQTGDSGTTDSGNSSQTTEPTYTQSDLDRAISKALTTRERELKAQAEREKAEAENNFRSLYEQEQAQRAALELERDTSRFLSEQGLSSLSPVFDADFSSLDGRKVAAKALKKQIDSEVQRLVNERLKSDPPAKSTKEPDSKLKPMSAEEWAQDRKKHGLQ